MVNGRLTTVPLKEWAHDLDTMARVEADIAYVVNPHNPTGTVRPRSDIERFVQESRAALVVVDEAYIDFTDDPAAATAMPLAAAAGPRCCAPSPRSTGSPGCASATWSRPPT